MAQTIHTEQSQHRYVNWDYLHNIHLHGVGIVFSISCAGFKMSTIFSLGFTPTKITCSFIDNYNVSYKMLHLHRVTDCYAPGCDFTSILICTNPLPCTH